jgi:4-aminobutyrate aminotransferase-like enzyme
MLRHAIIGDVRGMGLFIGVELVRDRGTMGPAAEEAADLINRVKDRGILLSTDGPLHNVLKIKPPMVLTEQDVDMVVRVLDDELSRTGDQ